MTISDYVCKGNEPHSKTFEIPDAVSEEEFIRDVKCSMCGAKFTKSKKSEEFSENKKKQI